jgi:hypothetical protein
MLRILLLLALTRLTNKLHEREFILILISVNSTGNTANETYN